MSRIKNTFAALSAQGKKGLIPFMTAGDPDPARTVEFMHALAAGGADVIEYLVAQGVPTDVVNDHGETALQTADNQEVLRWKLTKEGTVGKDGDPGAKRISETTDAFKKAMRIKSKVASN